MKKLLLEFDLKESEDDILDAIGIKDKKANAERVYNFTIDVLKSSVRGELTEIQLMKIALGHFDPIDFVPIIIKGLPDMLELSIQAIRMVYEKTTE